MFKLDKTNSTPEIIIEQNSFTITGVCTPENPPKFFELFKEPLDDLLQLNSPIEFVFHLDYFNTGSSKCLLNLFKSVNQSLSKSDIKITWIYEHGDEEMKESGELYAEIAEMDFNFVEANS